VDKRGWGLRGGLTVELAAFVAKARLACRQTRELLPRQTDPRPVLVLAVFIRRRTCGKRSEVLGGLGHVVTWERGTPHSALPCKQVLTQGCHNSSGQTKASALLGIYQTAQSLSGP